MKASMGPRSKFPLMADINMIPLIDVALVLLIIFMVMTPYLISSQIKINVPKTVTGVPADSDPIKIQINSRKTFYINGESIHSKDLGSALKVQIRGREDAVVLIEADKSVPFEYVVKAMDQAKANGAQKMGVAVTAQSKQK